MARLTGPMHSLTASKSFAKSIIFKRKGGRNLATHYSTPGSVRHFTPNAAQIAKRINYGAAVENWNELTPEEKAAYNERAKYKKYSGWNIFLKEFTTQAVYAKYGLRIYGLFRYGQTES